MRTKILRNIFIIVGVPFALAQLLVGQEQTNVSRLTAYSWVKPAPRQSDIAAMKNLMATKPSETLPLWTFSVQSSRDNNNYTGVMVVVWLRPLC